jgi:hypothetical protein
VEGKLSSEPDKQKLNIFKKISKVKEEKPEKVDKVDRTEHFEPPPRDSRESSPGLVIDESEANSRQREARMAQIDDCIESVIQRSMEIVNEPNLPRRGNPLCLILQSHLLLRSMRPSMKWFLVIPQVPVQTMMCTCLMMTCLLLEHLQHLEHQNYRHHLEKFRIKRRKRERKTD